MRFLFCGDALFPLVLSAQKTQDNSPNSVLPPPPTKTTLKSVGVFLAPTTHPSCGGELLHNFARIVLVVVVVVVVEVVRGSGN